MKKISKMAYIVLVLAVSVFCLTACGEREKDMSADEIKVSNEEQNVSVDADKESEESMVTLENDGASSNADAEELPPKEAPAADVNESKVLVAYFSATGTTKKLAAYAAEVMDADLYEIVPEEPYTDADLNYNDRNSRTSIEMNDASIKPAINGSVSDMAQYDIVFIGYAGGIIGLN